MKSKNIRFECNSISKDTLIEMYCEIGWGKEDDYKNIQEIPINESCTYYSMLVDDTIVGFTKILTDGFSFSILVEIVIKPGFQRKGYGTLLLNYTEEQIPTRHIFVHSVSGNGDFFLQQEYKESSYYQLFLKKIP